jgi:hypothetical protein
MNTEKPTGETRPKSAFPAPVNTSDPEQVDRLTASMLNPLVAAFHASEAMNAGETLNQVQNCLRGIEFLNAGVEHRSVIVDHVCAALRYESSRLMTVGQGGRENER